MSIRSLHRPALRVGWRATLERRLARCRLYVGGAHVAEDPHCVASDVHEDDVASPMTSDLIADAAAYVATDKNTKKLFIDGQWSESASGKTFSSINSSTGRELCQIAKGDREDVARAVRAARRALNGAWGRTTPVDRQNLLLALADLVEHHY